MRRVSDEVIPAIRCHRVAELRSREHPYHFGRPDLQPRRPFRVFFVSGCNRRSIFFHVAFRVDTFACRHLSLPGARRSARNWRKAPERQARHRRDDCTGQPGLGRWEAAFVAEYGQIPGGRLCCESGLLRRPPINLCPSQGANSRRCSCCCCCTGTSSASLVRRSLSDRSDRERDALAGYGGLFSLYRSGGSTPCRGDQVGSFSPTSRLIASSYGIFTGAVTGSSNSALVSW